MVFFEKFSGAKLSETYTQIKAMRPNDLPRPDAADVEQKILENEILGKLQALIKGPFSFESFNYVSTRLSRKAMAQSDKLAIFRTALKEIELAQNWK